MQQLLVDELTGDRVILAPARALRPDTFRVHADPLPASDAACPFCLAMFDEGISAKQIGDTLAVDDVAADFPELDVILAHPSFPWQEEALAIAVHKPNVYIDLSGWSPKYFPEILVRYTNTLLKHKMLFGSDFPLITPDRWLADFERLPIKDDVRPLVLKQNAAKLLRLVD